MFIRLPVCVARNVRAFALAGVVSLGLAACTTFSGGDRDTTSPGSVPAKDSGRATAAATPTDSDSTGPTPTLTPTVTPAGSETVGSVVRFESGSTRVDVIIDRDSPAARDFLSMLPLTVELKDFAGREKIADLPRVVRHEGTPGSDPQNGDLMYFTPWGNLGFYYDADGVGYSEQTLHLGTYQATPDELAALQGPRVNIHILT